jgi:hypothetical protein
MATAPRKGASAVHCLLLATGAVQLVATRGSVRLDLQAREIGPDGRACYSHAALAMYLADAQELLEQLTSAIAEASAGRVAPTPPRGWQERLSAKRAVSP